MTKTTKHKYEKQKNTSPLSDVIEELIPPNVTEDPSASSNVTEDPCHPSLPSSKITEDPSASSIYVAEDPSPPSDVIKDSSSPKEVTK